MFWKQVFAGSNPAAQTNFIYQADVAKWQGSCLRNSDVSSTLTVGTNYFYVEVAEWKLDAQSFLMLKNFVRT